MNTETRPNIVTIGVLAGAVAQLLVWAWNAASLPPLGASEAAAITTVLTAAAQWIDRMSKRQAAHVIHKYSAAKEG